MNLGGIERSLIGMLSRMDPRKVDVDLLLLTEAGDLLSQVPPWVNILPVPKAHAHLAGPIRLQFTPSGLPIALARIAAWAALLLRRAIGLPPGFLLARSHRYSMPFMPKVRGEYDLAISYMMPHDFVARKVSATRKVGWIHTDYASVESGVARGFELIAWQQMDTLVAVSREVAAAFRRAFPRINRPILIIENTLDPSWVRQQACLSAPLPAGESPLHRFCSVGRLSHAKGFDLAIEAAHMLRQGGLSFVWHIIGSGPEEPKLRQKIAEFGLKDVVMLRGAMANPYPEIAACDIYVQPSRYEGKSVSIREAQMLGKPVIVSRFPTVADQVEHGVDGYVAPPGAEGLVASLLELSGDSALRKKLITGTQARDYGNLAEVDKILALVPQQ